MRRPLSLPLALLPLALLVFSGGTAPAPARPEPPSAEVDSAALPEEDRKPFTGSTVQFEVFPEERRIRVWGGVDVFPTWYVADLSSDAAYRDGIFTLSEFHLYGNF